jgi:hypothetical protein
MFHDFHDAPAYPSHITNHLGQFPVILIGGIQVQVPVTECVMNVTMSLGWSGNYPGMAGVWPNDAQ